MEDAIFFFFVHKKIPGRLIVFGTMKEDSVTDLDGHTHYLLT